VDDCTVERIYANVCSHCGREWEQDSDGRPMCCDWAIAEWEEQRPKESSCDTQ
jgi:hypothetical protein